jgi:hypothetical protein
MALEVGHKGLTKLHVVRSMRERKALMADLSDAFVAPPGGFGTLEEFCGILNILRYYTSLLAMFDHAVEERFLKPENRALVLRGIACRTTASTGSVASGAGGEMDQSGDAVKHGAPPPPRSGGMKCVPAAPTRNTSGAAGGVNRTYDASLTCQINYETYY